MLALAYYGHTLHYVARYFFARGLFDVLQSIGVPVGALLLVGALVCLFFWLRSRRRAA